MVEPGASGRSGSPHGIVRRLLGDRGRLRCAPARRAVARSPDRRAPGSAPPSSAGVDGARLADGERADRHARPASARWIAGCPGPPAPCGSIGTPEHRQRSSCAAVMPGRCAAPPAPAMITLRPRALRASWRNRRGAPACGGPRRCATHARRPARVRISAACLIVSQSDWLPMMMPIGAACSVVKRNSLRKPMEYRF